MNGQVGCHPGDGIMDLFVPIAICQWSAGPAQLLAFGSIGVELADLSCMGYCTSLVTRHRGDIGEA